MDLRRKSTQLRQIIVDAVYKSKSGHIGGDLSVVDILNVLYNKVMNVNPDNPSDADRDRFILSKAHCVDALYAVLADKGYFPVREYVDTFCKFKSKFIGHTNTEVPGIDFNGGSLGHGIAVGVGMALAAKLDKKSYRVYVVTGDGEMDEGSNYEAMMAAAQYKLDNLCVTVDLNGLQISGTTAEVMNTASLAEKFKAFGWNVIVVADGNDVDALDDAYARAKATKGKPTAVIAYTVKGKGVPFMENNVKWHHGVLTEEQYKLAKSCLTEAQNVSN